MSRLFTICSNSLRTVVPGSVRQFIRYAMSNVFKEVAMADAMQTPVTGLD